MLSDLLKRLASGRLELDVVAEFHDRRALARRLQALHPDLVVLGLRRKESDLIVTALLSRLPQAKFIVVSGDTGRLTGYQLRLTKAALSNLPPDAVLEFIRPVLDKTDT